jgi:hypothetical protein
VRRAAAILCALVWHAANAAPWEFGAPLEIAPALAGTFHHLDGAGRAHLAVADGAVALAWEDNRSGAPQVYVAVKPPGAAAFAAVRRASEGREAFEPAIIGLPGGRFALAFEQDGAVWARLLDRDGFGASAKLADNSAQVSLAATYDGRLYAVWSRREKGGAYTYLAGIETKARGLVVRDPPSRVEKNPPPTEQYYPSIAATAAGLTVGWEDRRPGHTVILWTHRSRAGEFSPPRRLNDVPQHPGGPYGKGPAAGRVVLRAAGAGEVLAVWLDKRDYTASYDVYAAHSRDGGGSFGANERVQDEFGVRYSQWHPAVAANAAGSVAAVWDDDRDDTADLWLAWPRPEGWSDNLAVPGASGPGEQGSPVAALDEAGNLHLAWVERRDPDGPTRLRYLFGRRLP